MFGFNQLDFYLACTLFVLYILQMVLHLWNTLQELQVTHTHYGFLYPMFSISKDLIALRSS